MKNLIKNFLRGFIPVFLYNYLLKKQNLNQLKEWERNGRNFPVPHILKENVVGEFQSKSSYDILIETGSLRGNMIEAQKERFKRIISIEINDFLFKNVKSRFKSDKNVEVLLGDSAKILPIVLRDLQEPVVFYLDAHEVKGITENCKKTTPIIEELSAIINSKPFNHIILIDDAHYFNGKNGYPKMDDLEQIIKSKWDKYSINIDLDIIRIELFNVKRD